MPAKFGSSISNCLVVSKKTNAFQLLIPISSDPGYDTKVPFYVTHFRIWIIEHDINGIYYFTTVAVND